MGKHNYTCVKEEKKMSITANATFNTTAWEEKSYAEMDIGRKLTRVQATFAYQGDLEGEGKVEYLMAYSPDGTGSFVGLEYIVGRIGSRSGSFVAQHTGTFDPHSVTAHWDFVPGLGTQALAGLAGSGQITLNGHGPYPISFEL
jgi:hypothetical protein